MIADDIAAALPELRSQAESLMVDTCTIVGAPWVEETVDGVTSRTGTVKYAGKCWVRPRGVQAAGASAGGVDATATRLTVNVPYTVASVARDDEVTITAGDDPDLVGVTARVESVQRGTFSVQRRLLCSDPQNVGG